MRPTLLLTLLWCSLTLALAPDAGAQRRGAKGPKPEAIDYYDGKLEEALVEIKERNVPLLIVCCKEGEEANDRFREQLRDNGSFAASLGDTLVMLVNDGTHERKPITRRGKDGKKKRVEVCEAYHTSSCDHHKRNWDSVYQTFVTDHKDGEWPLPSALIITPEGELQTLIGHGEPPGDAEMLKPLKQVRAKFGPSITREQLKQVKEFTADGEAMASAKAWPDAWHAWNGVLQVTEDGTFGKRALEGLAQAELGLKEQVKAMGEAEGDPNARYPRLAEFAAKAQGTPVAKDASKLVKALEKHPDIDADLVRGVKLELEAEALLREARALLRAGDQRSAQRVLKKLTGKKYRDTPAHAEGLGLLED